VCVCVVSSEAVESSKVDTSTGLLKNDLDSLPVCTCACACACAFSFHRHSSYVKMCGRHTHLSLNCVCHSHTPLQRQAYEDQEANEEHEAQSASKRILSTHVRWKFSKISFLIILLHELTIALIVENF
jgi:hypothetical protein